MSERTLNKASVSCERVGPVLATADARCKVFRVCGTFKKDLKRRGLKTSGKHGATVVVRVNRSDQIELQTVGRRHVIKTVAAPAMLGHQPVSRTR